MKFSWQKLTFFAEFHMSAMYHLKAIAEIVQHYYPETLHRLFIVNAPSAFVVMFKVIKPWLNPRVSAYALLRIGSLADRFSCY
jgi:hypothetical protein